MITVLDERVKVVKEMGWLDERNGWVGEWMDGWIGKRNNQVYCATTMTTMRGKETRWRVEI